MISQPLISVHIPKAAGTTLLFQLRKIYGESSVLEDYQDDPTHPLSIPNIDPDWYDQEPITSIGSSRVVHGHFHPRKYDHLEGGAFRMTFLRSPIDNIKSIYQFWSAHEENFWDHPVFHHFKQKKLSLTRFAALPPLRNLYTCSYFRGFDMKRFDFIGDYEDFDRELARLGDRLAVSFDPNERQNVTAQYLTTPPEYLVLDSEFRELSRILKDDIEFYRAYTGR